jgi:ABC-type multidrug transport system permease subunit
MVDKASQPSWWLKEEEENSAVGSMILGGVFGMLVGIIIIFAFSYILFEAVGGNFLWLYVFAAGFVVIGAFFGWAIGKDKKTSLEFDQKLREMN